MDHSKSLTPTRIETLCAGPFEGARYTLDSGILRTPYRFCQLRIGQQPPRETLYLLHGGNGDDKQYLEAGLLGLIQGDLLEIFKRRGIQIILPFVGKSFLHQHPTQPEKSFSDCFFHELIPTAEARTSTTASTRWIGGLSMGGQAALNAFMRNHGAFTGVAAHFPTLVQFDYTNDEDVQAYVRQTSIQEPYLGILVGEFKNEFTDREDFLNHDPISILSRMSGDQLRDLATKRISFDVGGMDEFGLHEGCEAFHRELQAKGIPHRYECLPDGRHDGDFLVRQFTQGLLHLLA